MPLWVAGVAVICPQCGLETYEGHCQHHLYTDAEWATANRIMCDLIHRKRTPPRFYAVEIADDLHQWTPTAPPDEVPYEG